MVCRSVPSASLFHHFYELRINFGGGEAGREKSNATLPRNSDRVRLDARGIQTPDLEATSRCRCRIPFPNRALRGGKKKRPIKLPRVYIPAFYPTTYCARKEQNQNYINDIPLKSKNIHEGEGKKKPTRESPPLDPSIAERTKLTIGRSIDRWIEARLRGR